MRDEMIAIDSSLVSATPRSLQLDAELTLEKAKKKIRQQEAIGEQQQLNATVAENPRADVGSRTRKPFASAHPSIERRRGTPPRQTCMRIRCGRDSHPRERCPAKDVICHRCQRKGHFSSQCLSKARVSELKQDLSLDTAFLGAVDPQPSTTARYITLVLNGHDTRFKMDTEAEVTAITEETFRHLQPSQIFTPSKTLYGPSQCPHVATFN